MTCDTHPSKSWIQDKTFMWDPVTVNTSGSNDLQRSKWPNWYNCSRLLQSVWHSSARSHVGEAWVYGITGPVLNWTAAFSKNLVQRVVVDDRQSRSAMVDSGVPQVTVLGPLFFLLHIHDLPSVVDSQVLLFADNCVVYRPICFEAGQVLL